MNQTVVSPRLNGRQVLVPHSHGADGVERAEGLARVVLVHLRESDLQIPPRQIREDPRLFVQRPSAGGLFAGRSSIPLDHMPLIVARKAHLDEGDMAPRMGHPNGDGVPAVAIQWDPQHASVRTPRLQEAAVVELAAVVDHPPFPGGHLGHTATSNRAVRVRPA